MSPSTRKKSVRTLLALATSASLIAACGGGDDAAEAPAEAPAEESAEAPAEETASDRSGRAHV